LYLPNPALHLTKFSTSICIVGYSVVGFIVFIAML
jgi:hypothetical protein